MEYFATPWGFATVFTVSLLILSLALLNYRFKWTREGVSASKGEDKPEPLMPAKYAKYSLQIAERVLAHNNVMNKIWPYCLEKQMRIYEEREVTAIGMLVSEFVSLVEEKGLEDEEIEDETSRFRSHICNAMNVVKEHIRRSFRNNHYYEMEDAEWETYLKMKAKSLTDVVSGELDKFWRSPHLSRSELKVIGQNNYRDFEQLTFEMFRKAKQISVNAYETQQEEEAKYQSFMAYATGLKIEDYWCS